MRQNKRLRGFCMPTPLKKPALLPTLVALTAVGGLTALAVQLYRRPVETAAGVARAGMLLAGVREATCDAQGLPIHYYCTGRRGTPIVLIHGIGNSAEIWSSLIPRLGREYLVYAPDLPGFGKTPMAIEGVNIATHVLYLKHFLDALGYPRVILVGNSLPTTCWAFHCLFPALSSTALSASRKCLPTRVSFKVMIPRRNLTPS